MNNLNIIYHHAPSGKIKYKPTIQPLAILQKINYIVFMPLSQRCQGVPRTHNMSHKYCAVCQPHTTPLHQNTGSMGQRKVSDLPDKHCAAANNASKAYSSMGDAGGPHFPPWLPRFPPGIAGLLKSKGLLRDSEKIHDDKIEMGQRKIHKER